MKEPFDSARANCRVDDGVEASEINGEVDEGQCRGSCCEDVRGPTPRDRNHRLTTQGSSHLDALVRPAATVGTGDGDSHDVSYIGEQLKDADQKQLPVPAWAV